MSARASCFQKESGLEVKGLCVHSRTFKCWNFPGYPECMHPWQRTKLEGGWLLPICCILFWSNWVQFHQYALPGSTLCCSGFCVRANGKQTVQNKNVTFTGFFSLLWRSFRSKDGGVDLVLEQVMSDAVVGVGGFQVLPHCHPLLNWTVTDRNRSQVTFQVSASLISEWCWREDLTSSPHWRFPLSPTCWSKFDSFI